MMMNRLLYFALGVLVVVSIGAVGIEDAGIEFPDGSFQTTAAGFTASGAVQGKSPLLEIVGVSSCSAWATLYAVPSGKRLVIEWLTVKGGTLPPTATYPMDLYVRTHDGSENILHPVVRLENGANVGISFFLTQIWTERSLG